MSEMPHPLSDAFKTAQWRVAYFGAAIMRQDDKKKLSRLKREYQKATDRLLEVALADRETRLAATTSAPGTDRTEGEE